MKCIYTILALLLTGCGSGPAPPPTPPGTTLHMGVVNRSSQVGVAQVESAVVAFNARRGDLASDWGVTIVWVSGPGDKTCTLQDGTAGYSGPYTNPGSWRDPNYGWCTVNVPSTTGGNWQAYANGESICCALQRDVRSAVAPYAYPTDGVGGKGLDWIADYVFPNWFTGATPGPWDKMGKITGGPGAISPGGLPQGS